MDSIVLNFQFLAIDSKIFINFLLPNSEKYSWFWRIFVNIWTSNANKKKLCLCIFIIFEWELEQVMWTLQLNFQVICPS